MNRVQKAHEDFKQQMAKETAADIERVAEVQARMTEHTLRVNKLIAMQEWKAHGVKPPWVDEQGWPTVSLSLAKLMGWQIRVDRVGNKYLVAPEPQEVSHEYGNWEGS